MIVAGSPAALAHQANGADEVLAQVKQARAKLGLEWDETNTLVLRRGPYISAGGMDESVSAEPVTLSGRYVNLYDPRLSVLQNPRIAPDTRWLLVDLSRCPDQPWVIAAAGRISDETPTERSLDFSVAGMDQTTCAVRVLLPAQPSHLTLNGQDVQCEWDAASQTALLEFPNSPQGVKVSLKW
jgi:hypothetical protein